MATDEVHLEEDHSTGHIIPSNIFTGLVAVLFALRILARRGEPYTCVSSFAVSIVGDVLDALSDIGALVLPQPTMWSLRLSFQRKLVISLVFLLGTLYVSHAPCFHSVLFESIIMSLRKCHYC